MAQEVVAADPLVPRRGLTRAQYDVLVEAGQLDGEPVELIEGVLVEVVPQGEDHSFALAALNRWLVPRLPDGWWLRVQSPLAATDRSEPEPDLAVVRAGRAHPRSAALVIEVARSSHRTDLIHKPRVYAAAAVEQYWVVDLLTAEVVVHRGPRQGGYDEVQRLPWSTPLAVLGVPVDLAELLGGQ